MLNLYEFAVRQVFNWAKDDDGNPIYWSEVNGGDGYLIVWPSDTPGVESDCYHTYYHPIYHSDFEPWIYDD